MTRFPLLLLALSACTKSDDSPGDDSTLSDDSGVQVDEDSDGSPASEDCDDGNAAIFPGAQELCDSVDNDCDGEVDDDASDASTWYLDLDGDGYGLDGATTQACSLPDGYSAEAGDCDDGDISIHPGAEEADCSDPNDYNCDGSVGYADADGDGFAACEECDDGERSVSPVATEVCDGQDNDCDSQADEDDAADASTWYLDTDSDTYGDPDYSTRACEQPTGYADDREDCDDGAAAVNPSATEVCDEQDNNCDGVVDTDAADYATWYADSDGDGYGSPSYSSSACSQPSGYVSNNNDCDDNEPLAWTGATESCDSVDNDCDGDTDEGLKTSWYLDYDGDGYGNDSRVVSACSAPTADYASVGGDCDDTDTAYSPSASAGCDGEDYDCDGDVDNDADGDGYADISCGGDDCDDTNASAYPEVGGGCALGTDCLDILNAGLSVGDGTYTIDVDGYGTGDDPFDVYCDMSRDGGGWTLVMKQAAKSGYGSKLAVNVWAGWSTARTLLNETDATLSDANMANLAYSELTVTDLRLTASTTWVDVASGAWTYTVNSTPFDALSNTNANKVGNLGGSTTSWTAAPFTDYTKTTTDTGYGLCWRAGPWFNQTSYEYTNGGIKWGWFFNNECYQSTTDTGEGLGCCGNSSWYRGSAWTIYLWGR